MWLRVQLHVGKKWQNFQNLEKIQKIKKCFKHTTEHEGVIAAVHDSERYSCTHCDYKATRKGNLKQHIQSIFDGKTFQCKFCDHASKQKSHLKMHIVSVLYMKCLSAYNVILKPNQDTT